MIDGKVHRSSGAKEFISPRHDLSSQDLDHFTEAYDTCQTEGGGHTVNPNEVTALISQWTLIGILLGLRKEEALIFNGCYG